MKFIHLFTTLCLLVFLTAATLPNQYEAAMASAIEKLNQARSPEDMQQAANTFERIGKKETDKWLPPYYAAYAQVMMTAMSQENAGKDDLLDAALANLNKAKKLSENNSEILAVEGFIHMMRIPIDPASRGPQYSGMAMGALQKAAALTPDNPRAQLLLADMQYGMAQFFGSDTSEACKTLQKAIDLFEAEQPADKLAPAWGKEWAMQSKQQKGC